MTNKKLIIDLKETFIGDKSSTKFLAEVIAMQQKQDSGEFVDQVDEERQLEAFFSADVYCPIPKDVDKEKELLAADSRGCFDSVPKALPLFTSLTSLYGVYPMDRYDYDSLRVMELLDLKGNDGEVAFVFMPKSLNYFMTKEQLKELHNRYLEIVNENKKTADFIIDNLRLVTFDLRGATEILLGPAYNGIECLNTVTVLCMETHGDVDMMIVSNFWLDSYKITWEEAYKRARENTLKEARPKWFVVDEHMKQVGERRELSDAPNELPPDQYYCISFDDVEHNKGMGCFFEEFIRWIANKTKTDLYIFPQRDSICAMPCDETIYECVEDLNNILRQINYDRTDLDAGALYRCSSHGYYYSLKDDDLCVVETELPNETDGL